MRKYNWLVFLSVATAGYAEELSIREPNLIIDPYPSFTGPLLGPSANTVPQGHFNFEPYLYYMVSFAEYDAHWRPQHVPLFYSTYLQLQSKVGIAKNVDFQFFFQIFYNRTENQHYCNIGDLPIGFNIQLYRGDKWPTLLFSLGANVPLGKYQHLKAHLEQTDAIGLGSWLPGATVVLSKYWDISKTQSLNASFSFNYQVGTPVHVRGRNTYGGDSHTRGIVYPGHFSIFNFSLQYSFTQNWSITSDLTYLHTNKNRFSGKTRIAVGDPSSEQWSLAPAIEYDWSENLGLIAGGWFTFAGRNTPQFAAAVVAVNVYF